MTVLERSELQASPLADLYTVAAEVGLEGYRRMRKAELIDAILGDGGAAASKEVRAEATGNGGRASRASRAGGRARSSSVDDTDDDAAGDAGDDTDDAGDDLDGERGSAIRRRRFARARRGRTATEESQGSAQASPEGEPEPERAASGRAAARSDSSTTSSAGRGGSREGASERAGADGGAEETAEGVVELQGNGSAFLRVAHPESSDRDVYVSAGQVRRCELVSGDRVSGPIRRPRRSERYPSLVRVDVVNGTPTSSQEEVQRYEDLPVAYPDRRLALGSDDPTLKAIEWLTPIGLGSRALIVGASRAGKTEALRSLVGVVAAQEDLETVLVLSGVRPEEASSLWDGAGVQATSTSTLGASADAQGQSVERAVETAKRMAVRGGNVLVAIDTLDGLHPHAARKVLASARNLKDGGSLTIVATATRPLGGETTVIALDVAMTSTGRIPALDLGLSGTVKPELLVGDDGAKAIVTARAAALR